MWPPSKPCCNFSTPTASPARGNSVAVCWRCLGSMLLQTSEIGLSVCWMERPCRWKNWWNPSRHQAGLLMRFQVNTCWSIHLVGATPGEDSPHQRLSLLQGLLAASHKYQVGLTCHKGCKYMYRRLMSWYQVYMSWKSIPCRWNVFDFGVSNNSAKPGCDDFNGNIRIVDPNCAKHQIHLLQKIKYNSSPTTLQLPQNNSSLGTGIPLKFVRRRIFWKTLPAFR